ncbi:thioesterase family protein [Sinorhizobium terangae]|uniref:Thioesterase n=1 Tax=Sinorhizobium terangae TaxID=110322 RepID=A0A6N7LC75_SINTE|nr:thioesterase family protein [Sinorhizobium terangae]MBB4188317.1 fluoroacetyl-CoA thioesterase [Sinorhizobium terangae]MQX15332.1 thioesterase [Sinorhizobium terangae]WFU46677.1 thioesterase family protein [Sinorhizobium terangae]
MNDISELPILEAGLRHRERLAVTPFHTVPEVDDAWPGFRDMPPVFATAMMIGFIEQTCIEALRPYLTDQQRTVGTHVDVSHVAPTPVGMSVTADVELVAVDERSLLFKVCCCDEAGLIGEGTHRRAIIDLNRFTRRLADKAAQAS